MRYVLAIVAVLALLAVLGGVKGAQIATLISSGKKAEQAGPPPEVVATAVSNRAEWPHTVTEVASVTASRGVTLSNEAAGTVTRIHFESGERVSKGALLVELETDVEKSRLGAAKSQLELAETTMKRSRALVESGAIAPAQLDTDRAALETAQKDVAALEAQIALKEVRAPFGGRLGIRTINVGQYLAPGTPITELQTDESLFVDFTMPQERLGDFGPGTPVQIALASAGVEPRTGAVLAIEPAVDPTTRTVKVRASVPNEDDAVRPGMFVTVTVLLPEKKDVVVVPAMAIAHASYGDSAFVVEPKPPDEPGMRTTPEGQPVMVARQRFVKTGAMQGDFISVLEGLEPNLEVVTGGVFKLRNGAPIVVNNAVSPKPELSPRPQNR